MGCHFKPTEIFCQLLWHIFDKLSKMLDLQTTVIT